MRIRLPLKPLVVNWRHSASLIRYKMRCVPIAPGIQLHFSVHLQQPTVHTDSLLLLKMPKHRNCTDRFSGPLLSPYRKPSVQSSIIDDAEVSEQLPTWQQLASKFSTKQRIIIISGAGISTNAGSMSQEFHVSLCMCLPDPVTVPCFKSLSRTKIASRNDFDYTAYSSLESANLLYQSKLQILELASRNKPQPFELFMEQLAQSRRLHRYYSQNIDCRTSKLPALSQRIINLHGQLDRLRCYIYSQHKVSVQQQSLRELLGARCPICDEKNKERSREEKRLYSVGFLRPDVLLYNESNRADHEIIEVFEEDLR
jgi:NAD-dependent SIR2 family protein deacetylase